MAKKSSTYKRNKKAPKWQLPLLIILVLVAVGFGVFIVFFSKASSTSPQIYLSTSNTSSVANIPNSGGFTAGNPGDTPIACNWDGITDGANNGDTVSVYRPSELKFYILNKNAAGNASNSFVYGIAGDIPLCGNWDGANANGQQADTVGVYRPSNGHFYLRNSNSTGNADEDVSVAGFGGKAGDIPLACDWNGDGITDLGIFRPSEAKFYLALRYGTWGIFNSFQFGEANSWDYPVCGNWDGLNPGGLQSDTVGIYRLPEAKFYLKNTNSTGNADFSQPYGDVGFLPLVGNWTGTKQTFIGAYRPGVVAPAPAPATTTTTSTSGGAGGSAAPVDPCAGDLSANIKQLQTCLNSKGANLRVDGIVGPLTKTACINILKGYCPTNVVNYGVSSGSISGTGFMPGAGNAGGVSFEACNVERRDMSIKLNAYYYATVGAINLTSTSIPAALPTRPSEALRAAYSYWRTDDYRKKALDQANAALADVNRLRDRDCNNYMKQYFDSSIWTALATARTDRVDAFTAINDLRQVYQNGLNHVSTATKYVQTALNKLNGR